MTSSPITLPPPGPNQAFWDVSALEAGNLTVPCAIIVSTAAPDEILPAPALAFLLTSSGSQSTGQKPKRVLFDLGIRKDYVSALPPVVSALAQNVFTGRVPQDVTDSLAKGGLTPADIDLVCLSHAHWDHFGNPALFPDSRFLVGSGTSALLQPGYPDDPNSQFPSNLLPVERTDFLVVNEDWKPIGPFSHALDYFSDGSLYIVDAPGHLPGHLNLLIRISSTGDWLYLAGDSAHDWRLIRGKGEIAVRYDEQHGRVCMHVDMEDAAETIRRIADLLTIPRVRVILAHDAEWYEHNKGGAQFWPGRISLM